MRKILILISLFYVPTVQARPDLVKFISIGPSGDYGAVVLAADQMGLRRKGDPSDKNSINPIALPAFDSGMYHDKEHCDVTIKNDIEMQKGEKMSLPSYEPKPPEFRFFSTLTSSCRVLHRTSREPPITISGEAGRCWRMTHATSTSQVGMGITTSLRFINEAKKTIDVECTAAKVISTPEQFNLALGSSSLSLVLKNKEQVSADNQPMRPTKSSTSQSSGQR